MFLRALRICSNEYLNSEIGTITKIVRELQYPQYLIDKAHKSVHRILKGNNNKSHENNDDQFKNISSLPYNKKSVALTNYFEKKFFMYV